jgi:hypothetical protein
MHPDFQNQIESKTEEELLEIYLHSDQYQSEFAELVEQELTGRKVDLSSYKLRKEHRIAYYTELYKDGRPGNTVYIILGFVSALLGGFLGIWTGYVFSQSKHKEFGDGSFYVYDQKTRNMGIGMMALGIMAFMIELVMFATD